MKNKKKLIIDKYSQPIFIPNDLYIIKNYTLEDITSRFIWSDGVEIKEEELAKDKAQAVALANLYRKDDKHKTFCTAIVINDIPKDNTINAIGHESMHIAQDILEYSGIYLTKDTSETYAFTVGWICDCFYKTLKKKSNE